MAYTKVGWQNFPSTATPINATNLGKMDDAIYTLSNGLPYAYGTWTPSSTTATISQTTGYYYRIGKVVVAYCGFHIVPKARLTSNNPQLKINGLPFVCNYTGACGSAGFCNAKIYEGPTNSSSAFPGIAFWVDNQTASVVVGGMSAGRTWSVAQGEHLEGMLNFSVTYLI